LEVFINNKELEKLYTTGQSRKLRLLGHVIDKFFATVQKIEASVILNDLLADKGLRFEKLRGFENRYSMRLSGKFRLEMEIEWNDDKRNIGKFYMLTISNHYGN
jgi:plasmid maintenance system killer protein